MREKKKNTTNDFAFLKDRGFLKTSYGWVLHINMCQLRYVQDKGWFISTRDGAQHPISIKNVEQLDQILKILK